jgi:hypothetical protein
LRKRASLRSLFLLAFARRRFISLAARTLDLLAETEAEGHIFEILVKPTHPTVMLQKASAPLSCSSRRLRSQSMSSTE